MNKIIIFNIDEGIMTTTVIFSTKSNLISTYCSLSLGLFTYLDNRYPSEIGVELIKKSSILINALINVTNTNLVGILRNNIV